MRINVTSKLEEYAKITEQGLLKYLSTVDDDLADIFESARYSAMAGGKRIRPALLLEFYKLCGGNINDVIPYACAIEMIHTYSLIHDDLPCMDNDDLRRGKPTNHKVYGESTALLAGDGLQTRAFEIMLGCTNRALLPQNILAASAIIASCAGMEGMIGGQVLDLKFEEYQPNIEEQERMILLKTGKLIEAACCAGCALAGENGDVFNAAKTFSRKLGVAFQIRDDILDVTGNAESLGKKTGSDAQSGKTTFATVYGIEKCENMVSMLTQEAQAAIANIQGSEFLFALAETLVQRVK